MLKRILFFILVFMIGFLSHMVMLEYTLEQPADIVSPKQDKELNSPSDWISEDQIHVYDSHIVLDIENATWARFTDTNSMDPLIDEDSNGIEIIPISEDQIKVGDVVAYESDYSQGVIIHRVIEKATDDKGTYFIIKGDNNKEQDPGKVRFDQIKRVLVGVIY